MKVGLIGATGMIGSRILDELAAREHLVAAIARDPSKVPGYTTVIACFGDIFKPETVLSHILDYDVLISALAPDLKDLDSFVEAQRNLVYIAEKSRVRKLIVIGGAGSLKNHSGSKLMDSPLFPESWKGVASVHERALQVYKDLKGQSFTWTSVSPAAMISPGERTGKYRLSLDETLVVDDNGNSSISAEDIAVLVVDLVENDAYANMRLASGN
jgi:hypothetical protein